MVQGQVSNVGAATFLNQIWILIAGIWGRALSYRRITLFRLIKFGLLWTLKTHHTANVLPSSSAFLIFTAKCFIVLYYLECPTPVECNRTGASKIYLFSLFDIFATHIHTCTISTALWLVVCKYYFIFFLVKLKGT